MSSNQALWTLSGVRFSAVVIVTLGCAQVLPESSPLRPTLIPCSPPATQGLLKLPGVAGIYVCVLGHENSPWLKVILPEPSPEIERQIPCGCRVVTQIFREIRPLRP